MWFYEHPYPAGYKSYSRSKPLTIAEFDQEKAWWHNRVVNEQAWKHSVEELAKRNYNLDCKNPHQVAVEHGDPDTLMAEYQALAAQLTAAQQALKAELMSALIGDLHE